MRRIAACGATWKNGDAVGRESRLAASKENRMADEIIMYGSDWCGYTQRAKRQMETLGAPYRYVDVDASPEDEKRIGDWNNGRAIRPTFDLGGDIFVNPSPAQLESELKNRGLLKES
jgi:mycoredoxin